MADHAGSTRAISAIGHGRFGRRRPGSRQVSLPGLRSGIHLESRKAGADLSLLRNPISCDVANAWCQNRDRRARSGSRPAKYSRRGPRLENRKDIGSLSELSGNFSFRSGEDRPELRLLRFGRTRALRRGQGCIQPGISPPAEDLRIPGARPDPCLVSKPLAGAECDSNPSPHGHCKRHLPAVLDFRCEYSRELDRRIRPLLHGDGQQQTCGQGSMDSGSRGAIALFR